MTEAATESIATTTKYPDWACGDCKHFYFGYEMDHFCESPDRHGKQEKLRSHIGGLTWAIEFDEKCSYWQLGKPAKLARQKKCLIKTKKRTIAGEKYDTTKSI